jgi:hypothetical protein
MSNQVVLVVGSRSGALQIPYPNYIKDTDDSRWLDPAAPSSRDELTELKGVRISIVVVVVEQTR